MRDRRSSDAELDEIFRTSYRRLVVSMYALTGNFAEAQDIVAEAFVAAVAHRERLVAASNPEAWLRVVARNIATSKWRRAKRYASLLRRSAVSATVAVETSPDRVAVTAAIRELPSKQAEVIALHYIADLPVAEIADTLQVSVGTVKSRLSRARTALAALLGENHAETITTGTRT